MLRVALFLSVQTATIKSLNALIELRVTSVFRVHIAHHDSLSFNIRLRVTSVFDVQAALVAAHNFKALIE